MYSSGKQRDAISDQALVFKSVVKRYGDDELVSSRADFAPVDLKWQDPELRKILYQLDPSFIKPKYYVSTESMLQEATVAITKLTAGTKAMDVIAGGGIAAMRQIHLVQKESPELKNPVIFDISAPALSHSDGLVEEYNSRPELSVFYTVFLTDVSVDKESLKMHTPEIARERGFNIVKVKFPDGRTEMLAEVFKYAYNKDTLITLEQNTILDKLSQRGASEKRTISVSNALCLLEDGKQLLPTPFSTHADSQEAFFAFAQSRAFAPGSAFIMYPYHEHNAATTIMIKTETNGIRHGYFPIIDNPYSLSSRKKEVVFSSKPNLPEESLDKLKYVIRRHGGLVMLRRG